MQYISLNRTFQVLDRNQSLSENRHRYGGMGDKSWVELLLLRRVLIVGVAGAGKTVEMNAQCERLVALGEGAFFVSLSSVSRSGFRDSLSGAERDSFDVWLAATTPAYFFLDSKDEALNAGESLREAFRKLGIELGAALARAHIFVSTRPVDLAPESDLKDFRELCPFEGAYRPDETSDDVLLSITRREEHQSHAQKLGRLGRDDEFVAVQLTPLSAPDQRRYVEHVHPQSTNSVNRFLSALSYSGLAMLAAYPRDLSVFARYWLDHGHLGEILVMLEAYCNQLICEVREDAATSHSTSVAETLSGRALSGGLRARGKGRRVVIGRSGNRFIRGGRDVVCVR